MSIVSASARRKEECAATARGRMDIPAGLDIPRRLIDSSDAELEEAFSEAVSGWKPGRQDADYVRVWAEVFGEELPADCLRPRYCSSFDLVQPFLFAKFAAGYTVLFGFINSAAAEKQLCYCNIIDNTSNIQHWIATESLAKAAVIALLRAAGYTIEFSNPTSTQK